MMSNMLQMKNPTDNRNLQPEPSVNQNCTSHWEFVYDFMQRLFAERNLDEPLGAPKKDDIMKKVRVEVPDFT